MEVLVSGDHTSNNERSRGLADGGKELQRTIEFFFYVRRSRAEGIRGAP